MVTPRPDHPRPAARAAPQRPRQLVEIKGYRREDAKEKKAILDTYRVPAINHSGAYGRWAFAEFTDVYTIAEESATAAGARIVSERVL